MSPRSKQLSPGRRVLGLACGASLVFGAWVAVCDASHTPAPRAARATPSNLATSGGTVTLHAAQPSGPQLAPTSASDLAYSVRTFPRSFEERLVDENLADAGAIFDAAMASAVAPPESIYQKMRPYMDAQDFLWLRPTTVALYWRACVAARCERAAWLAQFARHHADELSTNKQPPALTDFGPAPAGLPADAAG